MLHSVRKRGRNAVSRAVPFTSTPDLTFFHPPSVYDFRERSEVFGPISDVIPSSPVFEMYPIGLTSIADYLEGNGYDARIVNLANQMLMDEDYDPEAEIKHSSANYFGIDLHWLPHCHGAIEIARLLKEHHPDTPVIFGGLSSSYFHDELIQYDCVDYVVRGDSTEEPILQLIETLEQGEKPHDVPNVTWVDDGDVVVNPLECVPTDLDYVSLPSYEYVIRSVVKYGSIKKTLPYRNWLDDPVTLLLLSRGCARNCSFCGGSRSSYQKVANRSSPALRSPEQLLRDVEEITAFSKGPIFVIHDLRMGGPDYAHEFLDLLEEADVENEFIFELFGPADEELFERFDRATADYSLQLSIESHDEDVRKRVGKFATSNEELERTLSQALDHGCNKIDLFFMVGLPEQTYDDAVGDVAYSRHLLETFDDDRIAPFTAPLAPFLDPGSPGYENPEEYGYRPFCDTIEEHRERLLSPSWKHMLSYETEWMSRDDIVDATYEAAFGMNELKHEFDVIDQNTYQEVKTRLERSQEVIDAVDDVLEGPEDERQERLEQLQEELGGTGEYSICGNDELTWNNDGFRDVLSLGKLGMQILFGSKRNSESETMRVSRSGERR
ncbi:B12-binding domain/radical SAM domain protein, Ta0216 family [Natronobacterium gregoryi]|uniref:Fe-S oxidoreductase n=6 Tax=Natronobacterium gregoryi TaxID=44930 RepID=L0AF52_NATGS|nr:Fe-S oxidoreductase [Natronobacterium gregoryi SP2]SFJ44809.1 B12-binding domain/radical SAM domain protein, Ta0216 family [Natronobacterium gregoryi]